MLGASKAVAAAPVKERVPSNGTKGGVPDRNERQNECLHKIVMDEGDSATE